VCINHLPSMPTGMQSMWVAEILSQKKLTALQVLQSYQHCLASEHGPRCPPPTIALDVVTDMEGACKQAKRWLCLKTVLAAPIKHEPTVGAPHQVPCQCHVLDAIMLQDEGQVGGRETTQTSLALHQLQPQA
jgi:hypothetical protein